MARNQLAKKSIDGSVVTFTFSNGDTLAVDVDKFSPETQKRLALHGAAQKVGDSYAGAKTVEDAVSEATQVHTNLLNGEWGRERGESADGSLLEQAYLRVIQQGVPGLKPANPDATLEDARAKISTFTDEQKKNLRKVPAIVEAIGAIQLERAKSATASDVAELF